MLIGHNPHLSPPLHQPRAAQPSAVDVPRPAAPGRGLRFRTWKNHAKIMGTSWKKTWKIMGRSWKIMEKHGKKTWGKIREKTRSIYCKWKNLLFKDGLTWFNRFNHGTWSFTDTDDVKVFLERNIHAFLICVCEVSVEYRPIRPIPYDQPCLVSSLAI